jgi:type IV pilus assembly protein PilC
MNKYVWKGIDSAGENKKGIIFASSSEHLKNLLLEQNIALFEHKVKKENQFKNFLNFSSKVSLEQKVFFFEQLWILINSGVELLKALQLVGKQTKSKKLNQITSQLSNDIQKGEAFSAALQKYNAIFSPTTIYLTKAGENSGQLGFVLEKISQHLKRQLKLKKRLKQAATMPMITLTFALLIVWGIFMFAIPQFETLFNSMGGQIPSTTKTIINISHFLQSNNFLFLFIGFCLSATLIKPILKKQTFQKIKDFFVIKIIFINKLYILYDLISYLQTLALCLKSGIPLKESLESASKGIKNRYFRQKTEQVAQQVTKGESLENSFSQAGEKYFPQNLIAMVSVGEQSGNLDQMLEKTTNIFEQELNNKLRLFETIFQPILMIIIGLVIAFLMLAIYLPIFNMASLF